MSDDDTPELLDRQQITYLMVTLTKLRQQRGISRNELARRTKVPVQTIHDFDDRKLPWQVIPLSFIMLYARHVGVSLVYALASLPNSAEVANDNPGMA